MRASLTVLATAVVLAALPAATQAQTRTTTRGAFGGAVSSDTTVGPFRGSVPQGATVGAARGAVTSDTVVGTLSTGPPMSIGGNWTSGRTGIGFIWSPAVPVGYYTPPFLRVGVIPFRGDASPGSVGAFAPPVPSDTVLGPPGLQEREGRLKSAASISMWDGNYKQGEVMVNRAVGVREEIVGGTVRPEVASALENNAKFLREWNRDAAAADMESRAKEIRTKLEAPPVAKRPERAERF